MDLSDEEAQPTTAKGKKRRIEEEKAKAKAKLAAKKRKTAGDDDEDYEDEYTAPSAAAARPKAGSFEKCADCSKKFTVVCFAIVLHKFRCTNTVMFLDPVYNGSRSTTWFPLS